MEDIEIVLKTIMQIVKITIIFVLCVVLKDNDFIFTLK